MSAAGLHPDPAKVEQVKLYPVPVDVTKVHQFLGLASYRRFIPDFKTSRKKKQGSLWLKFGHNGMWLVGTSCIYRIVLFWTALCCSNKKSKQSAKHKPECNDKKSSQLVEVRRPALNTCVCYSCQQPGHISRSCLQWNKRSEAGRTFMPNKHFCSLSGWTNTGLLHTKVAFFLIN